MKTNVYEYVHKIVPYGFSNVPLEVGAACRNVHCADMRDDDKPDNISLLNPIYLETTGMYYLWKNVNDIDIIGTEQYRRRLSFTKEAIEYFVSQDYMITSKSPILYGTIKEQYCWCHSAQYWDIFKNAVHFIDSTYDDYFTQFLENEDRLFFSSGMALRKSDFNEYCSFCFPILDFIFQELGGTVENVEKRVENDILYGVCQSIKGVEYQRSVCAFIQERCFTLWARRRFKERIIECPYVLKENTIL